MTMTTHQITSSSPTLKEYTVRRRLAPALFGDVLLCYHQPTQEMVAVKRIVQSAAARKQTIISRKRVCEDIALERAIYRQFNENGGHPHVLKMRQEIEADGYLYMVLDYCAKGELYDLVTSTRNNRLSISVARRYMHQILQGVKFIHRQGYAHRDLSLENVLITQEDECKICDFGLATSSSTFAREIVGKLFYMAPEVMGGAVYDALKADIWSLGVMLFIMLTGVPPVESAAVTDVRFRLIATKGIRTLLDRWNFMDELTTDAVDLIVQMMHVNPAKRISVEQALKHPFFHDRSEQLQVDATPLNKLSLQATTSSSSHLNGSGKSSRFASKIQNLFRRSKRIMAAPCACTASPPTIVA